MQVRMPRWRGRSPAVLPASEKTRMLSDYSKHELIGEITSLRLELDDTRYELATLRRAADPYRVAMSSVDARLRRDRRGAI